MVSRLKYPIILIITIIITVVSLNINIKKDVPTIYVFTISDILVSNDALVEETISYDKYSQMIIDDLRSIEPLKKVNRSDYQIKYYQILNKYSMFDHPETLEDCYTDDELMKLYGVVEAEVGDLGGFEERLNVASVIFNRINNKEFDDDLDEVLTKQQFSTVRNGRYKKVTISRDTVLACHYAFDIERINDCLYFESGDSNIHKKYADYIFTDSSGHKFYK